MEDNGSSEVVKQDKGNDFFLLLSYLAVLLFVGGFFYLVLGSVFPCGEDYLMIWQKSLVGFFLFFLFIIAQSILGYFLSFRKTEVFMTVYVLFSLSTVVPFYFFGERVFSYGDYYKDFNIVEWKKFEKKPMSMIRSIYRDDLYVGKKREELLVVLGRRGLKVDSEEKISYLIDYNNTNLTFMLKGGVVVECQLECVDPW